GAVIAAQCVVDGFLRSAASTKQVQRYTVTVQRRIVDGGAALNRTISCTHGIHLQEDAVYAWVVLHADARVGGTGLRVTVEAETFEQAALDFRFETSGERGHFRTEREAALREVGLAVHAVE